jgi:hypothetical protein
MDKEIFYKLWEITAEKEIKKPLESCHSLHRVEAKENNRNFRETVYSRYENERKRFRRSIGMREDDKLDRHKVAALFYVAFVDNTDGHSFNVFGSFNKKLSEAEASITHEIAFNIACGILEAVIIYDNEIDDGYRRYVEEYGIVEPELVCFDKYNSGNKTSYKEEILKQFICAQKEGKLSVAQVAFVFFSLENNSSFRYRITKASATG